jgi:hypothetical protein
MMNNLSDIEQSVSQLPENEFAKFRQWFWEFENQKWDARIKKDINKNKLDNLANEAIADYNKGKFKIL